MAKKMLIDATHAEETRVVVVDGTKVEEFDFESVNKRQLAGNIYLAKVTRVEPSLQAAFVDYGGNRHGFLAFSEIHPDYYQIPVADREALLAEEMAFATADAEEDEVKPKKRRSRRRKKVETSDEDAAEVTADSNAAEAETAQDADAADSPDAKDAPAVEAAQAAPEDVAEDAPTTETEAQTAEAEPAETAEADEDTAKPPMPHAVEGDDPTVKSEEVSEADADPQAEPGSPAAEEAPAEDAPAEDKPVAEAAPRQTQSIPGMDVVETDSEAEDGPILVAEAAGAGPDGDKETAEKPKRRRSRRRKKTDVEVSEEATDETAAADSDAADQDDGIEDVADEDVAEEIRRPRQRRERRYKIQEVIKVRQVLLVQVVKEERGNKGAALTTYLSLAGRYCVLMPNTARGGGISRKITNAVDRKKLKEIASEIEVPRGAGLIVRTAGAKRTKTEIKRDYDYLKRLWEQIRDLTLKSIAPAPIYEEGNLIKRSIRDLYSRDIDEVLVEGEEGYRVAKDFMKMLMPSHAKNVKLYNENLPLFARYQVESYLAGMFNPTVQLKSGGYLVIGVTEALVAIDVNSGRATKEGSIEETALKTNLEAAEEVARQVRLRDLAGLIVIDFIDMEERRNNTAVEKRLKDKLKTDRARIQVGRISGFGLLEMSRQRLRPGMLEITTQPCNHCHGTGLIRSDNSLALSIVRALEEEGMRRRVREVLVKAPVNVINYLFNEKREHIALIEGRYGLSVRLEASNELSGADFTIDKFKTATRKVVELDAPVVSIDTSGVDEAEIVEEPDEEEADTETEAETAATEETSEEQAPRKRRRRRRRSRRGGGTENGESNGDGSDEAQSAADADSSDQADISEEAESSQPAVEAEAEEAPKPKRRRRRRRKSDAEEGEAAPDGDAVSEDVSAPEPAPTPEPVAEAKADAPAAEAEPVAEAEAPVEPAESEAPAPEVDPTPETAETAPVEHGDEASDTTDEETGQPVSEEASEAEAEDPQAVEPELAEAANEAAPAQDDDTKPKRRGWWSLAR
ncbi:ribonuclease [Dinoroseobacter shibae DFL 12 = DSM 16493]|uniref:Ribonuclease E n=1 Tax=Dinoroseobacter shibae (strain DSM 16493 / NCIMB 14021 / DFL 12) TaxID=398580 RepID=A8LRP5_DINSH|nr:ribonuclease E/G [Dinoroseobacter shibae]ABV94076.1 ribonuclease [Dinoroseobacter shibae DFL 12 = DSM 16493]URF45517.1 Rne/Rng family ribonuclease [Dinoroseobacter shibae]URF49822.1 Rne/Rng family ribonuclease [Dinoroseobacter shibae]